MSELTTRVFSDDKVTIKVVENSVFSGLGAFTFSFSSSDTDILTRNIEEEKAVSLFDKAVRSYLTSEDEKKDKAVIASILSNFEI